MKTNKEPENRAYKVTLVLLLGLAAFTTAMKDLHRLHEIVSSVHQFTTKWHGTDLLTRNEGPSIEETVSTSESCLNDSPALAYSVTEYDSSDCIAVATDGYVDTVDYQNIPEPEVGATVDWSESKRTNPGAARLARANRNAPPLARRFAPSKGPKEEIASVRREHNLPARFEFNTLDRSVSLQIPWRMIRDIKADAVEHEISPEFVLGLLGKIDRKQSRGKAETRRRELLIKRLEGNVGSRRAS